MRPGAHIHLRNAPAGRKNKKEQEGENERENNEEVQNQYNHSRNRAVHGESGKSGGPLHLR